MVLIFYHFMVLLAIFFLIWISLIKILYHNHACIYTPKPSSSIIKTNQSSNNLTIIDPRLKLNHFTILGTHNSYHEKSSFAKYGHSSLDNQLSSGVRQIELDIHLMSGDNVVYHLQIIDDKTNCYCLSHCLEKILTWSEANSGHHPIFLFLEIKQLFYEDLFTWFSGGVKCKHMQSLKEQILQVFSIDSFILPGQIRGNQSTISSALKKQRENELHGDYTYQNYGWPPVYLSLGKILPVFLDDVHGAARKMYPTCDPISNFFFTAQGNPALPYASILTISNPSKNEHLLPQDTNTGQLTRFLVGYGDKKLMVDYELARKYGVHIISTDSELCNNTVLCKDVMSDFKKNSPVLCNTITAPSFCNTTVISI